MGLFDKKICDICGEKIGLLGNRKVEDGNVCKDCAKKLSPFFSERRKSTLADIREQLAYREANKAAVASFRATRTLGKGKLVIIDEPAGTFMVTDGRKIAEENPDVINLSQIRSCRFDVREDRTELKRKDKDGKDISYSPPRFRYKYNFYIDISVDHQWFDQIRYQLNTVSVEVDDFGGVQVFGGSGAGRKDNYQYKQYEALANDIVNALLIGSRNAMSNPAPGNMGAPVPGPAPMPAQAQLRTCQYCGAQGIPDEQGNCPACGGAY